MAVDKQKLEEYHKTNVKYVIVNIIIWFLVSLGSIFIVSDLNQIKFLGFPFGYYMGAQGSVLVFIIQIFVYSKMMDKLDKKYGFDEKV
jgi:putative solute:sodium symporter small subunit